MISDDKLNNYFVGIPTFQFTEANKHVYDKIDKIINGLLATWRLHSTYNHIYTKQSIVSGLIEAKKITMGNYSLRVF